MLFFVGGLVLIITGGLVTVGFWIPGIIDRQKLRDLLGPRYPLLYLVYSANGPVLLVAGVFLLFKYYAII